LSALPIELYTHFKTIEHVCQSRIRKYYLQINQKDLIDKLVVFWTNLTI